MDSCQPVPPCPHALVLSPPCPYVPHAPHVPHAPRAQVRKKRLHINPEALVPKLPKPTDLQPFPSQLAMRYTGHKGKV